MKNSSEYREKKNLLFMLVLMVHSIRYCYMVSIGKPRKKVLFVVDNPPRLSGQIQKNYYK